MKRYGDRGHPCAIPIACSRVDEVTPPSLMQNVRSEYIAEIMAINISGMPNLRRACNIAGGDIRSKALLQSNSRMESFSDGSAHAFSIRRFAINTACAVERFALKPNWVLLNRCSTPLWRNRVRIKLANTL